MERRKWKSSFRRFLRSAAAVVLAACMLPVPVQAAVQIPVDWCVHSRISGAPILK